MQNLTKKILIALVAVAIVVFVYVKMAEQKKEEAHAAAMSETIKVAVILGFTGPIESLTPAMAASAELAFSEASDSGKLLGGRTIESLRADSTCVDSSAATAAAERLVNSDNVVLWSLHLLLHLDFPASTTTVYSSVRLLLMHVKELYWQTLLWHVVLTL